MRTVAEERTQAKVVDAMANLLQTLRALHTDATPWLDLDLTMAQLKALMVVVQTDGVSSRGLANRLGISAPAVTPLVDRLIEQKLVRREDDPSDRRVVLITPTEGALALHDKLMETSRATVAAIVDALPEEELSRIERALAQLRAAAADVLARAHRNSHGNGAHGPAADVPSPTVTR